MTFGRLAVSDFELQEWTSLFYLFTVMFGFAFWSILDGQYTVESGILVNLLVPCIFSCIDSGIFWTGIFEMPEEYIMVEQIGSFS